jgi:hypothetical protein
MARPRELYSGAAPQAMSMMGQGIADAYARVGQIQGQGYAALGESIGKGLMSIGDYVKKVKDIEAENKSSENLIKNKQAQKFLGITPEAADEYLASIKDEKPSVKKKMLGMFMDQSLKSAMMQKENDLKDALLTKELEARDAISQRQIEAQDIISQRQVGAMLDLPMQQEIAKSIYGKKDTVPVLNADPFAALRGGGSPTPMPHAVSQAPAAPAMPQQTIPRRPIFRDVPNPFDTEQRLRLGIR